MAGDASACEGTIFKPRHATPSTPLRFALRAVGLALAFVLLQARWRNLAHGRRLSLAQQLPLPLDVLPLGVDSFLLPIGRQREMVKG